MSAGDHDAGHSPDDAGIHRTEDTLPVSDEDLRGAPRKPQGQLGRFELRDVLGRGGMGVVYEAWDPERAERVAVKVLKNLGASTRAQLARFARESAALGKLAHSGIVGVYETGWEGDTPWFVMPLIEGLNLHELVRLEGPQEERAAAELVRAVAAALEHAHEQGVVHRDVKPQNILVRDEDRKPLLLDFGLAHDVDSSTLTRPGEVLGTPLYMAPEQLKGETHTADARADVYGLGLVLYELLTGSPAFSASSREEVAERISSGRCHPPRRLNPSLSRDLEAICLKAIAVEPARRYPSMRLLRADLDRFLQGGTVLAREALRRESWRALTGPRNRARLFALVAVLAIGACVWLALRWRAAEAAAERERGRERDAQAAWLALREGTAEQRAAAADRLPADHPARRLLAEGLPSALPAPATPAQRARVDSLRVAGQVALDRALECGEAAGFLVGGARERFESAGFVALTEAVVAFEALGVLLAELRPGGLEEGWEAGAVDLCAGIVRAASVLDLPAVEVWKRRLARLPGGASRPILQPARVELASAPGINLHLCRYPIGLATAFPIHNALPCDEHGALLKSVERRRTPRVAPDEVHAEVRAAYGEARVAAEAGAAADARALIEIAAGMASEYDDSESLFLTCKGYLWLAALGDATRLSAWPRPSPFGLYDVRGGPTRATLLKADGDWALFDAGTDDFYWNMPIEVLLPSGTTTSWSWQHDLWLERRDDQLPSFEDEYRSEANRVLSGVLELAPGAYVILAQRPGGRELKLPFVVQAGAERRIDIPLELWTETPKSFQWRIGGTGYAADFKRRHGVPLWLPDSWKISIAGLRLSRYPLSFQDFRKFQAESGSSAVVQICSDDKHRPYTAPEPPASTFDGFLFVSDAAIDAYCSWLGEKHPRFRFRPATKSEVLTMEDGPHRLDENQLETPYGHLGIEVLPEGVGAYPLQGETHVPYFPSARERIWLVAEPR